MKLKTLTVIALAALLSGCLAPKTQTQSASQKSEADSWFSVLSQFAKHRCGEPCVEIMRANLTYAKTKHGPGITKKTLDNEVYLDLFEQIGDLGTPITDQTAALIKLYYLDREIFDQMMQLRSTRRFYSYEVAKSEKHIVDATKALVKRRAGYRVKMVDI